MGELNEYKQVDIAVGFYTVQIKKKSHYIQIPNSQIGIQQNEILTTNWNCKDYQAFLKSHHRYLQRGSGQKGRGRGWSIYILANIYSNFRVQTLSQHQYDYLFN